MSEPSRSKLDQQKLAKIKACPYDLDNPEEVARLYRECGGYLRLCHRKHGTDWEGRQFAMDALAILALRAAKPERGRVIGSNAAIENCARLVDLHAQEMRNNDLTLKPEGLTAIASAIRALKGTSA